MLARRVLLLTALALPLVACGGGGGSATSASTTSSTGSAASSSGSTATTAHESACELVSLDDVKKAIGPDATASSSFAEYCKFETTDHARSVDINITTMAQMGVPTLDSYSSFESAASLQQVDTPQGAYFDPKFSTIDFVKGDAFVYMGIKLDETSGDGTADAKDDELAALEPLATEAFANL